MNDQLRKGTHSIRRANEYQEHQRCRSVSTASEQSSLSPLRDLSVAFKKLEHNDEFVINRAFAKTVFVAIGHELQDVVAGDLVHERSSAPRLICGVRLRQPLQSRRPTGAFIFLPGTTRCGSALRGGAHRDRRPRHGRAPSCRSFRPQLRTAIYCLCEFRKF
jgi:hypothetical protein